MILKQLIDYDRFVLQLISLAGLHSNAAATGAPISEHMKPLLFNILLAELAARFKEDGMLAYVQLVQRKEKEINCDVLTHQKWYYCVELHVATIHSHMFLGAEPITLIRYSKRCPQGRQAHLPLGKTRPNTRSSCRYVTSLHTCRVIRTHADVQKWKLRSGTLMPPVR